VGHCSYILILVTMIHAILIISTVLFVSPTCNSDIAVAAESLKMFVVYDPGYVSIPFPNGDVDSRRGVCTDVVIRTLRKIGIDLQVEVYNHRKSKGLKTDTNIDHRRVPNMCAYFKDSPDWEIVDEAQPGDVIWWIMPNSKNHVGVVTLNGKVMHNCGVGQRANVYPHTFTIHKIYRYKCHITK